MFTEMLHGLLFGLAVAAPFGPVSLLCVRRSLVGRPSLGFLSGLGAATAQGAYASLAISGADIVASALMDWRTPVHLMSAGMLIALGIRMLRSKPARDGAEIERSRQTAYWSGLMLALSNPMTILPYLAVASASAMRPIQPGGSDFWMVPGVMFGAACWYAVLSTGAAAFGRGIPAAALWRLHSLAGLAFVGFGVFAGLS